MFGPGAIGRKTPEPHVAPGFAHHLRIGRHRVEGQHGVGPHLVLGEKCAAHIVHVIGIAVVRRTESDDGLEGRWPAGGHLQGVDAAPADSGHADISIAPGLGRKPGDDGTGVHLLQRQIFVEQQSVRVSAAADINPAVSNSMAGGVGMHFEVAEHRSVAAAIGHHLHDDRHLLPGARQPERRGQAYPFPDLDPHRIDGLNLEGEIRADRRNGEPLVEQVYN